MLLANAAFPARSPILYEHVNYFFPSSLHALHQRLGLSVREIGTTYAGQHLHSIADRQRGQRQAPLPNRYAAITSFAERCRTYPSSWHSTLNALQDTCDEIWVWGAGSRATAFLGYLPEPERIAGVIDINPRRDGTFVIGTSCRTLQPEALEGKDRIAIIVTNPIYLTEIRAVLDALRVRALLVDLDGNALT